LTSHYEDDYFRLQQCDDYYCKKAGQVGIARVIRLYMVYTHEIWTPTHLSSLITPVFMLCGQWNVLLRWTSSVDRRS